MNTDTIMGSQERTIKKSTTSTAGAKSISKSNPTAQVEAKDTTAPAVLRRSGRIQAQRDAGAQKSAEATQAVVPPTRASRGSKTATKAASPSEAIPHAMAQRASQDHVGRRGSFEVTSKGRKPAKQGLAKGKARASPLQAPTTKSVASRKPKRAFHVLGKTSKAATAISKSSPEGKLHEGHDRPQGNPTEAGEVAAPGERHGSAEKQRQETPPRKPNVAIKSAAVEAVVNHYLDRLLRGAVAGPSTPGRRSEKARGAVLRKATASFSSRRKRSPSEEEASYPSESGVESEEQEEPDSRPSKRSKPTSEVQAATASSVKKGKRSSRLGNTSSLAIATEPAQIKLSSSTSPPPGSGASSSSFATAGPSHAAAAYLRKATSAPKETLSTPSTESKKRKTASSTSRPAVAPATNSEAETSVAIPSQSVTQKGRGRKPKSKTVDLTPPQLNQEGLASPTRAVHGVDIDMLLRTAQGQESVGSVGTRGKQKTRPRPGGAAVAASAAEQEVEVQRNVSVSRDRLEDEATAAAGLNPALLPEYQGHSSTMTIGDASNLAVSDEEIVTDKNEDDGPVARGVASTLKRWEN